jgi:hypothetical protein
MTYSNLLLHHLMRHYPRACEQEKAKMDNNNFIPLTGVEASA